MQYRRRPVITLLGLFLAALIPSLARADAEPEPVRQGSRLYYLHAPAQVKDPTLIVWCHPSGGDAKPAFQWVTSSLGKLNADANTIILAPQSEGKAWSLPKDSTFTLRAIDDVIRQYEIDRDKVILGGHSSGGHFAYQFGVRNQDRFSLVMPAAGIMVAGAPAATINSPSWHPYHSSNDQVVPFNYAQTTVRALRLRGYAATLTEDTAEHNINMNTARLLAELNGLLHRDASHLRTRPQNLLDRFGGEAAAGKLFSARQVQAAAIAPANNLARPGVNVLGGYTRGSPLRDVPLRPAAAIAMALLDEQSYAEQQDAPAADAPDFAPDLGIRFGSEGDGLTVLFETDTSRMLVAHGEQKVGPHQLAPEMRPFLRRLHALVNPRLAPDPKRPIAMKRRGTLRTDEGIAHVPRRFDTGRQVVLICAKQDEAPRLLATMRPMLENLGAIAVAPKLAMSEDALDIEATEKHLDVIARTVAEQNDIHLAGYYLFAYGHEGSLAYQWAVARPELFNGLCLIATPAPDQSIEQLKKLLPVPVFLMHGQRDVVIPIAEAKKTVEAFREAGLLASVVIAPARHHDVLRHLSPPWLDWMRKR